MYVHYSSILPERWAERRWNCSLLFLPSKSGSAKCRVDQPLAFAYREAGKRRKKGKIIRVCLAVVIFRSWLC